MLFFKVFFLHRLWTTIAAIGSVNITRLKLDILPGYSTTPNLADKNSMKKDSRLKKKKEKSKKNYTFVIFLFFQFHFQADDYGINRLHHIWSDLYTYQEERV